MPLIADVTAAKTINTRKFTHGAEEVKQANVGVSGHKEKRRLCESVDFLSSG